MQLKINYISLADTLLFLKRQVIDSLPAAVYVNGANRSPEKVFNNLKRLMVYKNDPQGVELLQELNTLLNLNGRNRWRRSGAGDCDCFTIAGLACLWVSGNRNLQIVLAGRSVRQPVHIFIKVYDQNRRKYVSFDLTEQSYGDERPYPFKQTLKFLLL